MDRKRKETATIEHDSSIHEVYGQKKEGADYSYENTYSYQVEYVTLAETGDVLHQELREGNCYSSSGLSEILPGILDRVSKQFNHLRYRADSASYDKAIVGACEERGVKFYISADHTRPLMREVLSIDEGGWKRFRRKQLSGGKKNRSGKTRKNERITRSGYRIDASRIGKDVAKRELHRFSISRLDGNGGIDMW